VAVLFVVVGIAIGSWQVVVMAEVLGIVSFVIVTGRGSAFDAWSDRMERSWLAVVLTINAIGHATRCGANNPMP